MISPIDGRAGISLRTGYTRPTDTPQLQMEGFLVQAVSQLGSGIACPSLQGGPCEYTHACYILQLLKVLCHR